MAGAPERWRLGGGTRGKKARDRLDTTEPVLPFKCTYPVYLTDMMDTSPSSPADLLRSNPGSPVRGTRTRAVRVYEQTIQDLKKENFDLKLRLFIMEENLNKHFVNKGGNLEDPNGVGNVIINLQVKVENLKTEVENKSQLLHQTTELAENYESELKQLQCKFEKLQKESDDYAQELLAKNEELLKRLQEVPSKNEMQLLLDEKTYLADENTNLNELLSQKEASILELQSQLESVTNAKNAFEKKAKKGSLAIQGLVYKYHKDTENIPKEIRPIVQSGVQAAKDSNEAAILSAVENLKASLFQIMSTSSEGATNTSNSSGRKEATMQAEIEELEKSFSVLRSTENIGPSSKPSKSCNELSRKSSFERLVASSSESLEESSPADMAVEILKAEIREKSRVIAGLEQKVVQLERKLLETVSKLGSNELKPVEEKSESTSSVQISDKLLQTSARILSGDIDELREENLRLLLDVEKKEKDIADLQETIQKMEDNPNEISNVDMDYINERNELHQKLADCNAVNRDLFNHLKSLEKFMENLLLNKTMDSSMESLHEGSNYLSRLSSCLNQTMRLSSLLTDHLSVCEGSKVFDPSEFSMSRDYNQERTSLPYSDHSQMDASVATEPGRENFTLSDRDKPAGTGKRRLSFTNASDENLVYLGTSNNEDLLLLLNSRGDPEDVLIRNNAERQPSFHQRHWQAAQLLDSGRFGTWHPSSDSDIWSEPDREVSFQRIGIEVQKSPVSQKSPRRSRVRGRLPDESQPNESSSGVSKFHASSSKRRRCSDSSKSSFICKKCMSHQPGDAPEIENLSEKCKVQQRQLNEYQDTLKGKITLINNLTEEKEKLSKATASLKAELSNLKSRSNHFEGQSHDLSSKLSIALKNNAELNNSVKSLQEKLSKSEKECTRLTSELAELKSQVSALDSKYLSLREVISENSDLKLTVSDMDTKLSRYDTQFKELQSELSRTKSKLTVLDAKCSEYEDKLSLCSKEKAGFEQHLKSLEKDRQRLASEVDNLQSEKNELLQRIEVEKHGRESLERDRHLLNADLKDKVNTIKSMQAFIKNLEEKVLSLLREKEAAESKLLSSNSSSIGLKEELSKTKGYLEDVQSKISTYKQELDEASAFKQEVNDKLSSLISVLVPNLNNLKNICNLYLNLKAESATDIAEPDFETVSDKDVKIKNQLEMITSANIILEQRINLISEALHKSKAVKDELSQALSSVQKELKMKENKLEQLESQNQLFKAKANDSDDKLKSYKLSNDQIKSNMEACHQEVQSLENRSQEFQNEIRELEEDIVEKEKQLHSYREKETSLLRQVSLLENKIEKYQHHINQNEDEVTRLQEKIFNLQTQMNHLLSEKSSSHSQIDTRLNKDTESGSKVVLTPSREIGTDSRTLIRDVDAGSGSREVLMRSRYAGIDTEEVGVDSNSLIQHGEVGVDSSTLIQHRDTGSESQMVLVPSSVDSLQNRDVGEDSRTLVQRRDTGIGSKEALISPGHAGIGPEASYAHSDSFDAADLDESFSSSTSEKCVDTEKKQAKRIKALQAKVEFYEKRILILTKEKNDLREELVSQMEGNKRANKAASDLEKDLTEVKEKLEAKTSFIKDLKKELQNSYNLLIEKQKEVDELYKYKQVSEAKIQAAAEVPLNQSFSDPLHSKTESVIDDLKKRKWELVYGILKLEKQFYQKKNIHLGHFEKFRNHIENLRSLQGPPMQKSGSDPRLNRSLSTSYMEKCDSTLQNLQLELTLDVEYLQNLQIFLKRFFIPLILHDCDCSKVNPKTDSSLAKHSAQESKEIMRSPCNSISSDRFESLKLNLEPLLGTCDSSDRLVEAVSVISCKVDSLECALKSLKDEFLNLKVLESPAGESPKKSAAKSLLGKLENELSNLDEKLDQVSQLNSLLKSLDLPLNNVPRSPTKDMSDRESVLSEETITLSRSGSLSPMSFEEHFPTKLVSSKPKNEPQKDSSAGLSRKPNAVGGSHESLFHRSHFSSPDLGIESDPNHEGSAPEQGDFLASKKCLDMSMKMKQVPHSMNTSKLIDDTFGKGDSLHAIGLLQHFKLLKKEVQESLVGIKIVLSRTDDGLQHVTRFSSPRKNIESMTFKAIRDECMNIAICLQEASKLVDNFWIAPCPSVEELKALNLQNRDLQSQLGCLQEAKKRQQLCFEQAMEKLKNAEDRREKLEKNISRKLVKTKKVMREVENKMLHSKNQAQSPIPKYPSEQAACQSEQ